MSCDWSEYNSNIIATSGSDSVINVWDIRNFTLPSIQLHGSTHAVRRVRFSPFHSNILASSSFDHSTRIWNWQHNSDAIETLNHHTEFNYGLNWNRLNQNQLADCGWDSLVHVFYPKSLD